eukprot:587159_1
MDHAQLTEITSSIVWECHGYWYPRIVFLGSNTAANDKQLMQYDVVNNNMIDNGTSFTTDSVTNAGQSYAQISSDLFIISPSGDKLSVSHLDTKIFESSWKNIVISSNAENLRYACLASDTLRNLLYITGGYEEFGADTDSIQILNVSTPEWITTALNPPTMKQTRSRHTCNVHSDRMRLYVIAGYRDAEPINTIEYLDVVDLSNLPLSWQSSQNLIYDANAPRSVVYMDYIFVIGGQYNDPTVTRVDRIQTINTLSGQVTTGAVFSGGIRVTMTSAIVVQNKLYMFGGQTMSDITNTWQYYYLYVPSSISCLSSHCHRVQCMGTATQITAMLRIQVHR